MKIKNNLCSILLGGLVAYGLTACVSTKEKETRLESQAQISRADAERTALAKVPGGKIKDGELEEENGKLIYSFDIATPGTKDITEIHVDAKTGAVISVENESAASEAAEKTKEGKKK